MLRKAFLLVAGLVLLFGLCLIVSGDESGRAPVIWGGLMLLAVLLERWRYKAAQGTALDAEWQATEERFVDPESGQSLRVFYKPSTGERRYEPIDDKGP